LAFNPPPSPFSPCFLAQNFLCFFFSDEISLSVCFFQSVSPSAPICPFPFWCHYFSLPLFRLNSPLSRAPVAWARVSQGCPPSNLLIQPLVQLLFFRVPAFFFQFFGSYCGNVFPLTQSIFSVNSPPLFLSTARAPFSVPSFHLYYCFLKQRDFFFSPLLLFFPPCSISLSLWGGKKCQWLSLISPFTAFLN